MVGGGGGLDISAITASETIKEQNLNKKTSREEEKEGERVVGITAAVFSNVKNGATMSAREKTNCQNDGRRDCRSKPNQILTKLRD